MKIAYFDCFSGISGDMTLGAFLDAGLSMRSLSRGLKCLKLGGYEIGISKVRRGVIAGTKFDCIVKRPEHSHRTLRDIRNIINKSGLGKNIKGTACAIFENLATAEAKVHGVKMADDVSFHEVGNIDSIVDIVGASIAMEEMGIDEVRASAVNTGTGYVDTAHGRLPVPGPAAAELLKGASVRISDVEGELVTPTGGAILKTLVKSYGPSPRMKMLAAGYGAGSNNFADIPNMLRIIIGEPDPAFARDAITAIETNIDDMNPQFFEYLFEVLFGGGALDVYTTGIMMKKSRPAFKLTVLCEQDKIDRLCGILFRETTSIGVRLCEYDRLKLERKIVKALTRFGVVRVKVSEGPDGVRVVSPEYEDCAKIARSKKVPLRKVYDEAKSKINW